MFKKILVNLSLIGMTLFIGSATLQAEPSTYDNCMLCVFFDNCEELDLESGECRDYLALFDE